MVFRCFSDAVRTVLRPRYDQGGYDRHARAAPAPFRHLRLREMIGGGG